MGSLRMMMNTGEPLEPRQNPASPTQIQIMSIKDDEHIDTFSQAYVKSAVLFEVS
jgi:hypothetical protein